MIAVIVLVVVLDVLMLQHGGSRSMETARVDQLILALGGDDHYEMAQDELVRLGQDDQRVVQRLIGCLKHQQARVRNGAICVLGRIGAPHATGALPDLEKVLLDAKEDKEIRRNASHALGRLGPTAMPALLRALSEKEVFLRREAAAELGRCADQDEAVIAGLIGALGDQDGDVRALSCESLKNAGRIAHQALSRSLKGTDALVRVYSAEALLRGGVDPSSDEILPILEQSLRDPNVLVRRQAASALRLVGCRGATAVAALRPALWDEDLKVRASAAFALGRLGSGAKVAVPDLIKSVGDRSVDSEDGLWIRTNSAVALGEIGPEAKEAVPYLVKALEDDNELVRCAAARALGKIACEEGVIPHLLKLADSDDEILKGAAEEAVKRIRKRLERR